MKYGRFEWLMIAVGGIAVAGMAALLIITGNATYDGLVAHLLLFGVLVGAVHRGRNGGFVAAVAAIVGVIALRAPVILSEGLSPAVLRLIAVEMGVFGLVGIVGGEAAGRMKYLFAGMEDDENVDADTHVYTGRYLAELVGENLRLHDRYGTPFTCVLVSLAPALTDGLDVRKRRQLLRSVADRLRNDVRLVDDVGRLDDGSFVVVLPQTHREGGATAAGRVCAGVAETVGAADGAVSASVLSVPKDSAEIASLCGAPYAAAQSSA